MADDTAIQQIKIPITETKHRLKKKLNTAMPTTLMPPPPPPPPPPPHPHPRVIEPNRINTQPPSGYREVAA